LGWGLREVGKPYILALPDAGLSSEFDVAELLGTARAFKIATGVPPFSKRAGNRDQLGCHSFPLSFIADGKPFFFGPAESVTPTDR
jgi:hypothetical protein